MGQMGHVQPLVASRQNLLPGESPCMCLEEPGGGRSGQARLGGLVRTEVRLSWSVPGLRVPLGVLCL